MAAFEKRLFQREHFCSLSKLEHQFCLMFSSNYTTRGCAEMSCQEMSAFLRAVLFPACKAQILPETSAGSPLLWVGAETRPRRTSRVYVKIDKNRHSRQALNLFKFFFPPPSPHSFSCRRKGWYRCEMCHFCGLCFPQHLSILHSFSQELVGMCWRRVILSCRNTNSS